MDKWSPEFISAKGNQTGKCPLSYEWIYQWIWACKHGNKKEDAETNNSTSTLDTVSEGVNGEIEKIIGVLYCIGYPLKIGQLL